MKRLPKNPSSQREMIQYWLKLTLLIVAMVYVSWLVTP
jgi:hypothetical protein